MKIIDIINGAKPSLSFEVFPPKTSVTFETTKSAAEEIAGLSPGYMSVTYGAGGTTDIYTAEIAASIASKGVTPLAHLTCIGADEAKVESVLSRLKMLGIENILALRGDLPAGVSEHAGVYMHASDLAEKIRSFGDFCIGGACYPEGHPESADIEDDVVNLRIKIDSGCEFLTTQMFFDNRIIYDYMDRLHSANISVPVVPGIMPITSVKQIERIISISGSSLPDKLVRIVEKYGYDADDMKRAGIEFAIEQIRDLYEKGFNAVHVYSMNKPDVARAIQERVSDIISR